MPFVRRAEAFLEAFAAQQHVAALGASAPVATTPFECADRARRARAYGVWRDCAELAPARGVALPLGAFQLPATGWLVVTGNRGLCREVRAYDAASGSAYVARLCEAPLGSGPHHPRPSPVVSVGAVPTSALREAVWMTLLTGETEKAIRPASAAFRIPEDLAIERAVERAGAGAPSGLDGFGRGSTEQSELEWRFVVGGATRAAGKLTWPSDLNDGAAAHAVRLLEIAELGFENRCATAAPPPTLDLDVPVEGLDSDEHATHRELVRLLRGAGRCGPPAPRRAPRRGRR